MGNNIIMSDKHLGQVKYLNVSFNMVHSSTLGMPANSEGETVVHISEKKQTILVF
jgi:hypothetical protein